MVKKKLGIACFAVQLLTSPLKASDTNEKLHLDCTASSSPTTVIRSCTALLKDDDDPDTVEIYTLRRAYAYAETNQVERAIRDYTAVLKLNPRIEALFGRGDIYFKTRNYERAIADYRSIIERAPFKSVRKVAQERLDKTLAAQK